MLFRSEGTLNTMSNRTRSQVATIAGPASECGYRYIDTMSMTTVGQASVTDNYVKSYESIDSFYGSNGAYRPCLHVEWHQQNYRQRTWPEQLMPLSPASRWWVYPFPAVDETVAWSPVPLKDELVAGLETGITDAEWSDYDTWALGAMLPSMSRGLSVLNFAWELKDFKFLFNKRPVRLLGDLRKFLSRLTSLPGKGKTLPYREASQLVLMKEFAIDPLISDLQKIYRELAQWETRLRYLQNRADRVLVGHHITTLSDMAPPEEVQLQLPPHNENGDSVQMNFRREHSWLEQPRHIATVKYIYEMVDAQGPRTRLKALLDVLGVKRDPSIIWNAIPFSFVVDWFVDVSSFLNAFSVDNLRFRVKILDFCSSVKVSSSAQLVGWTSETFGDTGNSINNPEEQMVSFTGKSYERRTLLPDLNASLSVSGLSGREAFLSAALIGANVRR